MPIATIEWADGKVRLIDQTLLPIELKYIECRTVEQIWEAIKVLRVRGAPAIGIAAALGTVLGVWHSSATEYETFRKELDQVVDYLATSRPTAVNLFWALERMRTVAGAHKHLPVLDLKERLLQEAIEILQEDQGRGPPSVLQAPQAPRRKGLGATAGSGSRVARRRRRPGQPA